MRVECVAQSCCVQIIVAGKKPLPFSVCLIFSSSALFFFKILKIYLAVSGQIVSDCEYIVAACEI